MSINYIKAPFHSKENTAIRGDLKSSIHYKSVPAINAFQRILLKANGTVTELLEAYLAEPIAIVKLSENLESMKPEFRGMKFDKEERVIVRKVLLQGKSSRQNFIYADSLILIDNLDERFSYELLNTKKPIGKLWSQEKVETFKEVIDSGKEAAGELAKYFCIESEESMLFRTYSVSSQRKVTMIITEKFPENSFPHNSPSL
ncbi:MAG: DUF98 domain-containing protein [Leptolyngbya sp. SIO1D8]|nr:DUF98 domain-containing protein [Leptolyngbya sp. SIO1D8]